MTKSDAVPMRYYSTGEVARECGVTERYLQDLIRRGKVPAPRLVANRRLWAQADLDAARTVVKRNA